MLLSKAKKKDESSKNKSQNREEELNDFQSFIKVRDFAGALTVLEFQKKKVQKSKPENTTSATAVSTTDVSKPQPLDKLQIEQWISYCQFHAGDYQAALDSLKRVKTLIGEQQKAQAAGGKAAPVKGPAAIAAAAAAESGQQAAALGWSDVKVINNYIACCCFYLGMYEEAEKWLGQGKKDPFSNRLRFHLAFKKGDENLLFAAHRNLTDNLEDQLTLASMHYLRGHYDKALDSYKQIHVSTTGSQKLHALDIYIGMCMFKMDENDTALGHVMTYLREFPDSVVANNLKACIDHKLFSKLTAMEELGHLKAAMPEHLKFGRELVQHNEAVFAEGLSPMKTLQPLVDVIPEARINLAIHHLRNQEVSEAKKCLDPVESSSSHELVLKASIYTILGQESSDDDLIESAKVNFKIVGESANDRDTIIGRQCMASYYILNRMHEEALVYLKSIKPYLLLDDTFNMNYAQCLAAMEDWAEMDESLSNIRNKAIKDSFIFKSLALKCNIMNKRPQKAWQIYNNHGQNDGSIIMLQMLSAECYRTGQFVYAARGYALLVTMADEEIGNYQAGLRGAIVGLFQQILAGEEPSKTVLEVLELISFHDENDPKLNHIGNVIRQWAKENNIIRG